MESSAVSRNMPSLRRGRHMFTTSDDAAMIKQILSTHAPDGREVDVKPILHIVEDILNHANAGTETDPLMQTLESLDERDRPSGFQEILQLLSFIISRISCEIAYKCSVGEEPQATAVEICNIVSSYTWDAKVVIVLAAFAVYYGEFWLVAQISAMNPLAKGIALLKQLPEILERPDLLKQRFETLTNLIKAMLQVTNCIVELKGLPTQYIATDDSAALATATAHIPTAVYWTIRSVVACTSQIMGIVGMGPEFLVSTTEAWELSGLAHKVNSIHSHLMQQLDLCRQHVDEKRQTEAYQTLVRLFDTTHTDNMKILKALIYAKDDLTPLFCGMTKRRVTLDLLRRKLVLLIISDLEVTQEDLSVLFQLHNESRQYLMRVESQFELVWIPVTERSTTTPWNEEKQNKFESLQAMMPWYSVHHPSIIDPAVIRYIKEVWRFTGKPLVVVLDSQGKVANPNALHMMAIWGSMAYPFTSIREEALWKDETWRIDLLADNLDINLQNWIVEWKHICLYGGEDMEWIRKFTSKAREAAQAVGISLEMLYVGKSNPGEKIKRITDAINAEKLSHVLSDNMLIWYFWMRLESMWHSKVRQGSTVENDPIMSEVVRMLSFDSSDQGWAVISRMSDEMAKANGDIILKSLEGYAEWKEHAVEKGFIAALSDYICGLRTVHHCSRLILRGAAGSIPDRIVCAECGRQMEKLFMYRCCVD